MANHLKMVRKQTVLALLKLGWSYRRIELETGVRRETVAKHDPERDSKAARAPTGEAENRPGRPPGQSLCEPWRELIEAKLKQGLDARRIHQDLVHEHGFAAGYDSVKRFCRGLRKSEAQVFARIVTGPGEQLQADFFKGAPTLTERGRHRRPHVFRAVLSYSRHSYEEAVWRQDLPTFIRCFENAFRFFGGSVGTVRIDNQKTAVSDGTGAWGRIKPAYRRYALAWRRVSTSTAPSASRGGPIRYRSLWSGGPWRRGDATCRFCGRAGLSPPIRAARRSAS